MFCTIFYEDDMSNHRKVRMVVTRGLRTGVHGLVRVISARVDETSRMIHIKQR